MARFRACARRSWSAASRWHRRAPRRGSASTPPRFCARSGRREGISGRSICLLGARLPVRPRGSGDPDLETFACLAPGFPLARERTERKCYGLAAPQILSRGYVIPEITPLWIHLLDKLQFPSPIPFLDLAFAYQGRLARLMLLVPNQHLDPIFAAKSGYGPRSMLPDAPNEIIRHAGVQRSISSACEDVHEETHCVGLLGPRFRGDERRMLLRPYSYSVFKQPIRWGEVQKGKRKSAPVCGSGPGGRPHSLLPSPSQPRGSARHKAHDPGYPGSVRECVVPGRARIAGPWA